MISIFIPLEKCRTIFCFSYFASKRFQEGKTRSKTKRYQSTDDSEEGVERKTQREKNHNQKYLPAVNRHISRAGLNIILFTCFFLLRFATLL